MNIEELKRKSLYKMTNEELLVLINVLINEKVVVMFENDKLKGKINKIKKIIEEHSLNVNGEIEDVLEVEECKYLMKIINEEDDYAHTTRP